MRAGHGAVADVQAVDARVFEQLRALQHGLGVEAARWVDFDGDDEAAGRQLLPQRLRLRACRRFSFDDDNPLPSPCRNRLDRAAWAGKRLVHRRDVLGRRPAAAADNRCAGLRRRRSAYSANDCGVPG